MIRFKNTILTSFSFFIILVSAILLYAVHLNLTRSDTRYISINNNLLKIELANTPQQRAHGLSGRESLCKDCAMLFVFSEPSVPAFWMKDMNFPLDIIWIKNNIVVGFKENLPPLRDISQPIYYRPNKPVTSALELPAGWVKNYSVKVGDIVKF